MSNAGNARRSNETLVGRSRRSSCLVRARSPYDEERRRGKVRKPRRKWYRKARALVVTDFKRASSSHVFTYPVHARVSILSASIHVLVAETRTSGARTSERSRPTQRTDRRPTLNFIHTHAHTCAVRSRRDAYAEYETTFPWIEIARDQRRRSIRPK